MWQIAIIPFFAYYHWQRNSDPPSSTEGLLSLLSANENLHIIHITFTLTYPSINKSKYKTHPRCIVIFERFQNYIKCNVNVILQLMKTNIYSLYKTVWRTSITSCLASSFFLFFRCFFHVIFLGKIPLKSQIGGAM